MRAYDGTDSGSWSSWYDFTTDATAPNLAPAVDSTDYPAGTWSGGADQAGSFTLAAQGVSDVNSYLYGLDQNPPTGSVAAGSLGGSATVTLTPATAGPHTLYVQSLDRAGNKSPLASYAFYVGSAAVTSPGAGAVSAGTTVLQGAAPAGTTGVTFEWRRADTDAWITIPSADVTYTVGGGAVSWPVASSGGTYPKVNWNLRASLAQAGGGTALAGPLQVHAVFSGGPGGTSPAVRFTYDPNLASGASEQVGPGSVNLVTGAYTLGGTDVSVSGLVVSRSFNTRQVVVRMRCSVREGCPASRRSRRRRRTPR
jgi:hypothetical protein